MESGGVPADMTREILSRLPVRSLVRFRIACREWSSIMDEPHFIAAHLDHSKSLPPAITTVAFEDEIYNTIYLDNGGDPTPASTKPISMGSRLRPTNSINGIICIPHVGGAIELLNPATEESLILPSNFGDEIVPYLGYRPETKEYKIVCFVENFGCSSTRCEVYTLGSHGTGSWRRIQDFQFYPFCIRDGICIDGKLYCITHDNKTLGYWTITTLDLATEKFSDIVISNFHQFVKKHDIDFRLRCILELEGKLCVVVWQPDTVLCSSDGDLYFYVLGDDGGWVEKASFNIPWEDWWCRATPLMIRKGKVYVKTYFDEKLSVLRMIHLESRNWSEICAHMMVSSFYVSFFAHGESLVSPRNL